ncbi:hypothetical protein BH20ACT16_BH20ACT16_15850 [soil metagenome]
MYAFGMTYVLLRVLGALMPLRGSDTEEAIGMDIIHHGEEAYASGEGAMLILPETPSDDAARVPQKV